MQLSGSRCKTANFNDRQEHAQLVQCRCSGIRNHACFLERNGQYYPGIANRFISLDCLPGLRFQPDLHRVERGTGAVDSNPGADPECAIPGLLQRFAQRFARLNFLLMGGIYLPIYSNLMI